ncbi:H(+)-transporting V1 sector ATPase subunit D [Ascosphaera pollenicola]|nr:H(+)-transporting V1 sector ATPase subunit D [Ascosphaera pollenicola]
MAKPDLYLISDEDTAYEQEVLREPENVKSWLNYIEFKQQHGTLLEQAFVSSFLFSSTSLYRVLAGLESQVKTDEGGSSKIMERACVQLPRSYKLWKLYLEFRVKHLCLRNPAVHQSEFIKVNRLFERSLILLNKMPRIWEMYLSFLLLQPLISLTRKTFDRALRALPITQHNRLWKLYKMFARSVGGVTATKIYARYMQIHPENAEEYMDILVDNEQYTDAIKWYLKLLNDPRFQSKNGKGTFQLWADMVDLVVSKAKDIETGPNSGIDVDKILRSGIDRFSDQRGKLWTGLATYWVNRGNFEKARDVFEEGITTVMTVRDFTMIFDTYVEFEESIIGNLMDAAAQPKKKDEEDTDWELDLRMLRFEQLMDRRPFLINDVLLRQNPHNVIEWSKRVALWGNNKNEVVKTYTDAIAAIDPKKAHGKFSELWMNYAKFYEEGGDLDTARVIMDKAVKVPFKSVMELAEMWCEWAEMEIRNDNAEKAVDVMAKATQAPKKSAVDYFDESLSPQQRLHKSWKVWSFYVDLVEGTGTLEETKAIYERIFELRIATPQTVVNYANLLEEHKYYEESFRIYERGLQLFTYPVAFELWNLYLTKAMDRKIHLERLRDLFEQALDGCPAKFAKTLYLMYGNLEEERGLSRHAMRIYERATRAVSDADRFEMYNFYITKSASNFGLPSTRVIYERAIEELPNNEAKDMCLKYAEMEKRLGEIDRARAIYGHGAQFSDPRVNPEFWQKLEQFEVQHGNEDTFKEMLRIKRSTQAKFNTDVNFIASQAISRSQQLSSQAQDVVEASQEGDEKRADAMSLLERQARAPVGFVAASTGPEGRKPPADTLTAPPAANPDAIDLDNDTDDEN